MSEGNTARASGEAEAGRDQMLATIDRIARERDAARVMALEVAAAICLAEIALTPFDATSHVAKAALKRAAKKIRAEAERIERGGQ